MSTTYICRACCRDIRSRTTPNGALQRRFFARPTFAPKPVLDLKHMRQNPGLYEQNCIDRNYPAQAKNAWRILEIHDKLVARQKAALDLRKRNNELGREIKRQAGMGDDGQGGGKGGVSVFLEEARRLKEELSTFEEWEKTAQEEMMALAIDLPNLSSHKTPVGEHPQLLGHVNGWAPPDTHIKHGKPGKSHVEVGKELDILDFEASAVTSGWGWYFLKNQGALLEQALVQFALSVALKKGWKVMTPPSLVYGHIASACGFMPRDQHGETQIYTIAQEPPADSASTDRPTAVLAGTAEIPFAGSQANKTFAWDDLPLKVIGPSRSYRAEAGARGVDTKGLYRVHEFTKVEMFAWTVPPQNPSSSDSRFGDDEVDTQAENVFDEMISIQKDILTALGLHARILEMPTTDLGASASRKIDIEAFFPSRLDHSYGSGEVTSASMCTDYQTRRLGTRVKLGEGGGLSWPHTLNGTAMAIPRILAAILENHWDEKEKLVRIPECLWPFMLNGGKTIGPAKRRR